MLTLTIDFIVDVCPSKLDKNSTELFVRYENIAFGAIVIRSCNTIKLNYYFSSRK